MQAYTRACLAVFCVGSDVCIRSLVAVWGVKIYVGSGRAGSGWGAGLSPVVESRAIWCGVERGVCARGVLVCCPLC